MLNFKEINEVLERLNVRVMGAISNTQNLGMLNKSGKAIANQHVLLLSFGNEVAKVFQSYDTIIAIEWQNWIILDSKALDYSTTTTKYLKQFIKDDGSKKDIQKRIDKGFYPTANLNLK